MLHNQNLDLNVDKFDHGGFLVCKEKKFMFIVIAKNASTTLKRIVYEIIYNRDSKTISNEELHNLFGFTIDGELRITIQKGLTDEYSNYIKFAVYRDPVERFCSVYFDKVSPKRKKEKQDRKYFSKCNILDINIDGFIEFTKKELNKINVLHQDEHLRRQADYYQADNVDYIVPLSCLDKFMKEILDIEILSRSNTTKEIGREEITKQQVDKIKKLYSEDYGLIRSGNVYK